MFEKHSLIKSDPATNFKNEKLSTSKNLQSTNNFSNNSQINVKTAVYNDSPSVKSVYNIITPSQTISCASLKNDANEKINDLKKPMPEKIIQNMLIPPLITSNSSLPTKKASEDNTQKDVIKTDNLVIDKKVHKLQFLKNLCVSGISEIPSSKPPPCICEYCVYTDNLPVEQSVAINSFPPINGLLYTKQYYPNINSKVYASNTTLS